MEYGTGNDDITIYGNFLISSKEGLSKLLFLKFLSMCPNIFHFFVKLGRQEVVYSQQNILIESPRIYISPFSIP
jgi:hypothetical protein